MVSHFSLCGMSEYMLGCPSPDQTFSVVDINIANSKISNNEFEEIILDKELFQHVFLKALSTLTYAANSCFKVSLQDNKITLKGNHLDFNDVEKGVEQLRVLIAQTFKKTQSVNIAVIDQSVNVFFFLETTKLDVSLAEEEMGAFYYKKIRPAFPLFAKYIGADYQEINTLISVKKSYSRTFQEESVNVMQFAFPSLSTQPL